MMMTKRKETKLIHGTAPTPKRSAVQDLVVVDHDFSSTVGDDAVAGADTASLVTESSSEAVVSLFNCWSSVEEASPFMVSANGVQEGQTADMTSKSEPPEPGVEGELAGLTVTTTTTSSTTMIISATMADATTTPSPEEVLRRLKKRLRPADMPTIPILKRRQRPTCCFINYLGPTRLDDHHRKCGLTATNLVLPTHIPGSSTIASSCTPQPPRLFVSKPLKGNNDDDEDHDSFHGAFNKSPDLTASFSPVDVELEELDLLEPLFAEDDDCDNQMLFPTSVMMMNKASNFPLIGQEDDCFAWDNVLPMVVR